MVVTLEAPGAWQTGLATGICRPKCLKRRIGFSLLIFPSM